MDILNLTAKQLRQAAAIQERIQSLQAELSHILGAANSRASVPTPSTAGKRNLSAAGRARISAAAKARWAKLRGSAPAQTASKPKRHISEAARAKLAALAKARWRKAKAAGRTAL